MSYFAHLKFNFLPMLLSRTIPVLAITLMFAMIAHSLNSELAVFSYALAILAVVSALFSMCLSATGNLIASPSVDVTMAQRIFSSGLYLSAVTALAATLTALALTQLVSVLPGAQKMDSVTLTRLMLIYIACIPLTIFNTFFHLFHESSGFALHCTKLKTIATLAGGGFLAISFLFTDQSNLLFCLMCYFILTEGIVLACFIKLSKQRSLQFRITRNGKIISQTLTLGLPIALGLGGQKIYFYLLNEQLAFLDFNLVSQLAIFMTLAGILLLPFISLGQAHSLYVSKTGRNLLSTYAYGIGWLILLTVIISITGVFFGSAMFTLVGGSTLLPSSGILAALLFFLVSNGLMSISMGHLRGMNDTLKPQIIVNVMIFITLIPIFYFFAPVPAELAWYMEIQSGALLMISAVLSVRIWILTRPKTQNK